MPYTNPPYGPYQLTSINSPSNGGNHWWVQAQYGNDGFDGNGPDVPMKTMTRAFLVIKSGDTIHFSGKITEQLDTPVGIFDVCVIGEGTHPRHADAHSSTSLGSLGGRSAATWAARATPATTTPLLRVRQQGWRFANILWAPPSADAALEFMRDAGAGDAERDSSHSEVLRCRFAGGADGILISGTENVFDLLIDGNTFNDHTGSAIKGTVGGYRHLIQNNVFGANANHIIASFTQTNILNNVFGSFTTKSIDLTGGGGLNRVTKNYLSGTYTNGGGYTTSNANDEWAGNFNTLSGGITVADPAA